MANFFEGLFDGMKSSIERPVEAVKDVFQGDFKGAFDNIRHIPGDQERANSKMLNSVGIGGWVGDNPVSIPAAIVGGIYGAGALGSMGGASGASAGGGAAGFNTGASSAGSVLNAPAGYQGALSSLNGQVAPSGFSKFLTHMGSAEGMKDLGDVFSMAGNTLSQFESQDGSTTTIKASEFNPRFSGAPKDNSLQAQLLSQAQVSPTQMMGQMASQDYLLDESSLGKKSKIDQLLSRI